MSKNKQNNPDKVSFGKLFAWQTRPISLGAVTIIVAYLSLYCTSVLGMEPALVGTVILASKIFDGVTDIFAGWIIDNTKTKWGKARPYEISIVGVWICMYALFSTSVQWSTTAKAIWIFIMYSLIFSVFSTFLNACETPYAVRAFKSTLAITKISAYGGVIITIGCMIVSISFPMLVGTLGTTASGWTKLIGMYAVPLLLIGLLRFFFVKEIYEVDEDNNTEKIGITEMLTALKGNKYIWLLAIASAIPQLITAMSAGTYYFQDYFGDIGKLSVIQAFSMVALIVMCVFPTLMKKFSAMDIVCGCTILGIAGYVLNFFAGVSMPLLIIGFLASGISAMPLSYMRSPIIIQIADYNEARGLRRMEATIASATNFICKIFQGIGSFLIGIILSLGGYDGAVATQSETALMAIRLSYSIVPAILLIPVVICCVAFKPLDRMQSANGVK